MNKFLTLMRRDIADNRGALIITPLVVAGILLAITIVASLTGGARFGVDPSDIRSKVSGEFTLNVDGDIDDVGRIQRDKNGRVTITDEAGNTRSFRGKPTPEEFKKVAPVIASASAIPSFLPLGIAGIAILFALAGALHDERKDRTILFWKSLPVSDLQTVGAKLVAIIGVGLGFAFAISVALHIVIATIASITFNAYTGLGVGAILMAIWGTSAKIWLIGLCAMLLYIAWALPVFSWTSMVSAWAPKVPFIAAFAPLVVVPLGYMAVAFRGNENDPLLNALWEPLGRLIGEPVFTGVESAFRSQDPNVLFWQALSHLGGQLTQPALWIGMAVAAAFIYAASEIRRRRAL